MLPDLTDALTGARALLGWKLIHDSPEGLTSGYIVETEAYTEEDPASHAYGGKRLRNAYLFHASGTLYVYFTYGMHYCFNIVTGEENRGQGVLIRAVEPVEGIELMKKRRGLNNVSQLTNGPAKLVQALGITKDHGGTTLYEGNIRLEPGFTPKEIVQTTRVGIKKAVDQPWRFYVRNNPYVSRK